MVDDSSAIRINNLNKLRDGSWGISPVLLKLLWGRFQR